MKNNFESYFQAPSFAPRTKTVGQEILMSNEEVLDFIIDALKYGGKIILFGEERNLSDHTK